MKHVVALAAVAVASLAGAQEWRFELSNPVLSPGVAESTTVTLAIDPGPAAYAFAGAALSVRATEEGWSDIVALLSLGAPPYGGRPGQFPGMISGPDVTGISVGQHFSVGGWLVAPGRLEVWQGTFTVTDFTVRQIDLSTVTDRFEVYIDEFGAREPRTPIESSAIIQVIPAPAGLALLGLGALAGARRRGNSTHRREPPRPASERSQRGEMR